LQKTQTQSTPPSPSLDRTERFTQVTTAQPPQEPTEILVGRTAPAPIAEAYCSITIKSFKRVGTSIYFYLQYKPDLSEIVEFIMDAKANTMSDNLGNQYAGSVASFVGTSNPRQTDIPRGAFANAVLRFDGVSADAAMATALQVTTWWSTPSHPRSMISRGRVSHGDFVNIPLVSVPLADNVGH
jgi:hypothetical protein